MIRSRLLVIACLAAVVGSVTSWYVYRSLEAKFGAIRLDVSMVTVAARNIQAGDKIQTSDVRLMAYPTTSLPAGALRNQEVALGRIALLPMMKGEFVLPYKIGADGENSLTAQIPVGMRAVQVPVNETDSGSLKSGDRIDVFSTGIAPESNETQTRTVLTNVRLLAIGARAVTVVVAPEDAEKLILAIHESQVKIVLRNPADTSQDNVKEVTRSTL